MTTYSQRISKRVVRLAQPSILLLLALAICVDALMLVAISDRTTAIIAAYLWSFAAIIGIAPLLLNSIRTLGTRAESEAAQLASRFDARVFEHDWITNNTWSTRTYFSTPRHVAPRVQMLDWPYHGAWPIRDVVPDVTNNDEARAAFASNLIWPAVAAALVRAEHEGRAQDAASLIKSLIELDDSQLVKVEPDPASPDTLTRLGLRLTVEREKVDWILGDRAQRHGRTVAALGTNVTPLHLAAGPDSAEVAGG